MSSIISRAQEWVPHPELEHIDDGVSYACSYCMRVDTEEVLLKSMERNGIDVGEWLYPCINEGIDLQFARIQAVAKWLRTGDV
tara:strand:- start:1057 stop:1305 length:249 start_codon:yes stop_codon:yes gene_type:complete